MHKIRISAGEEVGLGADTMIEEDKVLEDPKMDMAFAAHGWPSVESGKIGIVRRYAFGCVGDFKVRIIGKKGHASWPEQTIDPIAAANEIYQHIPAILTRTIGGTEPKIMSVTYMQAGDVNVRNIIPQDCVFGGTMRAVKEKFWKNENRTGKRDKRNLPGIRNFIRQISGFTGKCKERSGIIKRSEKVSSRCTWKGKCLYYRRR